MSFRSVPVTPESCQLQHLQHVLRVGVKLAVVNTRYNRPVRVATDFALVQQASMGHTPLELSRSAEASLMIGRFGCARAYDRWTFTVGPSSLIHCGGQQAAGRRTRRPGVVLSYVYQETLPGERQEKLCRRNLRASQLLQHQVK